MTLVLLSLLVGCADHTTSLPYRHCAIASTSPVELDDVTPIGIPAEIAAGVAALGPFSAVLEGRDVVPQTVTVQDEVSLTFSPTSAEQVEYTGLPGVAFVDACPTGTGLEIAGTLRLTSSLGLDLEGPARLETVSNDVGDAWIFAREALHAVTPESGVYAELAADFPCANGPRAPLYGALNTWDSAAGRVQGSLGDRTVFGIASYCENDLDQASLLGGEIIPSTP